MHRRRALRLALALAGLVLAGCGEAPVRAVPFGASDSVPCRAVAERWPATLGPYEPRVTAVASPGVAAWGDPPIVARCGKVPPGPTTDPCIDVNGIDWVATRLDDGGTMFTTYGRDPAVEVLVPAVYEAPPLLLPPFGEAVATIPQDLGECTAVETDPPG